jgi:hypothetical protein
MKPTDYTGQHFGRWTVLNKDNKPKQWICRCKCGKVKSVNIDNLKAGKTRSCGCFRGDHYRALWTTHGESKTKLYYVWLAMRNRCNRPGVNGYERYGGRGIKVCEEWMYDFPAFRDWALSNGYKEGLEIDRIDNDGNYESSNCRWVTRFENMQNTRLNKHIEYNGKAYTINELSDMCGLSPGLIGDRLRKGWTVKEAITLQPKVGNNQNLRGKNYGNLRKAT